MNKQTELLNKVEQMTIEEARERLNALNELRLEATININERIEASGKQIAKELGLEDKQVRVHFNSLKSISVMIMYLTHDLNIELLYRRPYGSKTDTPELSVRSSSFELLNNRKDEALEFLRVLTTVTQNQEELLNIIKTKELVDAENYLKEADISTEVWALNKKINDYARTQQDKVIKESIDANPVLTFTEMETIKEDWHTVENRRGEAIIFLRHNRNEVQSLEVIKRFPKGDYRVKLTTEPNYWGETTREEYMTKNELETLFKKVRKLDLEVGA